MDILRPLLAGIVSIVVLDGLWLWVLMGGFYRTALGPIARTAVDGSLAPIWAAAAPVYVLLAVGQYVFVMPKVAPGAYGDALLWGAIFGLVVYGVYDFTNWSTLRGYSPTLAFVDIGWGMAASAAAAAIMRFSMKS
jgi:uncharacterized membrane protein